MSARPRQAGAAGALFPPIEVGSFVSRRPDKSEFIGSASGVFFINTVFRAFAAASPREAELAAGGAGADRATTGGDPGSFHNLLTAADDTSQDQLADGDVLLKLINSSTGIRLDGARGQSYGVNIPELGAPPTPAAAKKLLMIYFQKWHPIFPFLHGPTFFDKVNQFYSSQSQSPDNRGADFDESLRDKLCRAVCFQCVFNIAATNADGGELLLESRCRITSPAVLTGLLGIIAGDQDMHTLQVLLAMELYLVSLSVSAAAKGHTGHQTEDMVVHSFTVPSGTIAKRQQRRPVTRFAHTSPSTMNRFSAATAAWQAPAPRQMPTAQTRRARLIITRLALKKRVPLYLAIW
ncbi:hypothetical protein NHJ13051_005846 [Beauveria bassiana]